MISLVCMVMSALPHPNSPGYAQPTSVPVIERQIGSKDAGMIPGTRPPSNMLSGEILPLWVKYSTAPQPRKIWISAKAGTCRNR